MVDSIEVPENEWCVQQGETGQKDARLHLKIAYD
jgi:hypothetical protein